ncbi:MAG: M23 family metallopeptidase [Spirochaetales bacterium]|nr:M23 family metallopeptidase [Spirochaetales bacterium]
MLIEIPPAFTLEEIAREADGYSVRFAAPAGTEVPAFLAGIVVEVSYDEELGLVVVVSDGAVETIYAHLSAPLVREGDLVEAGAPLALSGMTGAVLVPTLGVRFRFLDGVGRKLRLVALP